MQKQHMVNGLSVLLFRIFLSGIFIIAGITHLVNPAEVAQRIHSAAFSDIAIYFGDPYALALATGYVLIAGGTSLFLGIYTRWAAAILFMVLIPITITIQFGNGWMHGPLWKNIALFGGLIFFIVNNPKIYSIYNR